MATANLFAEKYLKDLGAHNKRVENLNRPSHAGLDHIQHVLGSADSRFVSFERIGSTRKEEFRVYLYSTGFSLKDGYELVLRRDDSENYDMGAPFWVLEVRSTRFGIRRRTTVEDTVELAAFCSETPSLVSFA